MHSIRRLSRVTTSERFGVQGGSHSSRSLGVGGVGLLGALIYVVVVGGTGSGELHPVLRALNASLAAALIGVYVVRIPVRADQLDRILIAAVILFAVAGALSQYPRQSFDAVLAAIAYAAAFFVAREQLGRDSVRHAFARVLIGLSVLFSIGAAALWLPQLVEWWSLTDRSVLPPLDAPLSAGPWGHRYDMALLIVLLYPAWWIGRPSLGRRIAAVLIGCIGGVVIAITGSRTIWLAVGVASLVMGIPLLLRLWRRYPRAHMPAALGFALIGAAVVLSGAATPLAERVLNLASLDVRLAMWGPLIDLWVSHPVAGIGPGAFPWALQLTRYFDTLSWAPRHPDNAIIQVLPEAGLLGLAALMLVAVSVLAAVFRGRSGAARWVAVAFAVACLGTNPTDFAFLVAMGLAWVAYAAPHGRAPVPVGEVQPRRLRAASVVAVAVISLAYVSTLAAAFSYDVARSAVARGATAEAEDALDTAIGLDPGMALYHRQRGALAYLVHDAVGAVTDLERAVGLNPSDDLAWRTLALARVAAGDRAGAHEALDRAVAAQRSDAVNLLLAARSAAEAGRQEDAVERLAEVVQSWPGITAAAGWQDLLPGSVTTADIVDEAAERWLRQAPTPEFVLDQGVWLGVLSGRPDILNAAIARGPIDEDQSRTLASLIACDPEAAAGLGDASPAQRRSHVYWQLRVRASVLAGAVDLDAVQALQIMTSGSYTPAASGLTMNPLNENAGYGGDRWGYRRPPIEWPTAPTTLPSTYAGTSLWMFDPSGAVDAAGLGHRLPQC